MDREVTKRSVLKSVSASGIGLIGFMGTGYASHGNENYEKITGKERERTVKKAIQHGETKRLLDEIQVEENSIIEDDAIVYSFGNEKSGSRRINRVVIADIDTPEFKDIPTLTWTDNPHANRRAYISTIDYDDRIEKRSFVKNNTVQTIEEELSSQEDGIGISSDNNLDPGDGGSDDCVYLQEQCTDVRWTCVADVLITYGACASAIIPSLQKAAVLLCLADVGNSALQGTMKDVGCSICSDTDVREIDVCDDGWEINPP